MKCKSGKHEWDSEVCAKRCCAKGWKRALRLTEDSEELDKDGRTKKDAQFVYGWIKEKDYRDCLKETA